MTDEIHPTPTETLHQSPPVQRKFNWIVFSLVLLSPIVGSCIAGALEPHNGDTAPTIALLGGGIAGIVGGTMLGNRIGKTTTTKILLGFLFIVVLATACIGASCFGCLASGYQFNIH
jgi:hypothetical protein